MAHAQNNGLTLKLARTHVATNLPWYPSQMLGQFQLLVKVYDDSMGGGRWRVRGLLRTAPGMHEQLCRVRSESLSSVDWH